MTIGLVGCVGKKLAEPAPAQDLYSSPLFKGRRAYVEETCDRWFILSAKHGLVEPHTVLSPYNQSLDRAPRSARRAWSHSVLAAIDQALGDINGIAFELHAGQAYLDYGLVSGLKDRGALPSNPVHGLQIGQQLAFNQQRAAAPPERLRLSSLGEGPADD